MAAKLILNLTLAQGTEEVEYSVRIIMADMARWDILRAKNFWPKQEDAPTLWMQVVSYFALVRSGQIPTDADPLAFLETVISIEDGSTEEAADFPAK